MARPTGMAQISPFVTRTGVVVALSPTSDPTHQIQLERANGSSTGTFQTVAVLAGQVGPGQYPTYTDVLPDDGVTRVYRAKAVKQGYTDGAYTALLKAKPAIIPEGATVQTPITGHKITSNISLSTAAKLQYGSADVTTNYTKSALYPPSFLVPKTQATKWSYSSQGYLWPNTTTGTQTYIAPVYLPPGTKLGTMTLWGAKRHSGTIVKAVLTGTDFTELTATYCTLTLTTSGDTVTSTAASGVTIFGGNRYNWTITLKTTGGSTDGQFKLLTMEYLVPDYAKTI